LRFYDFKFTIIFLSGVIFRFRWFDLSAFNLSSTGFVVIPLCLVNLYQLVLAVFVTDVLDVELAQLTQRFGGADLGGIVLAVVLGSIALVLWHVVHFSHGCEIHSFEEILARELWLFVGVGFLNR